MPEKGVHTKDDYPLWLRDLEWSTLEKETPGGFVVYEVVLKVRREGFQAVIKAEKGPKGVVAFTGGRDIKSLSGQVQRVIRSERTRWKVDEYF